MRRRRTTHPIPQAITTLELTDADKAISLRAPRPPLLGHRLELNRPLRDTLAQLIPTLTDAVHRQDPTLYNDLNATGVAPSARPHVAAHLTELRASTPSHKGWLHHRINGLERGLVTHPRG